MLKSARIAHGPDTQSPCPHCRGNTQSGTHNGCGTCGKVKHTRDGKLESIDARQ